MLERCGCIGAVCNNAYIHGPGLIADALQAEVLRLKLRRETRRAETFAEHALHAHRRAVACDFKRGRQKNGKKPPKLGFFGIKASIAFSQSV